jgi:hypothetical protein
MSRLGEVLELIYSSRRRFRTARATGRTTLAFAVLLAAPGVLAVLGLRGRPALILAGGALGIFLAAIGAVSLFSLA